MRIENWEILALLWHWKGPTQKWHDHQSAGHMEIRLVHQPSQLSSGLPKEFFWGCSILQMICSWERETVKVNSIKKNQRYQCKLQVRCWKPEVKDRWRSLQNTKTTRHLPHLWSLSEQDRSPPLQRGRYIFVFCCVDTIPCRDSTQTAVFVFDRHSSEIIQSEPRWELCILPPSSDVPLPLPFPSVEPRDNHR